MPHVKACIQVNSNVYRLFPSFPPPLTEKTNQCYKNNWTAHSQMQQQLRCLDPATLEQPAMGCLGSGRDMTCGMVLRRVWTKAVNKTYFACLLLENMPFCSRGQWQKNKNFYFSGRKIKTGMSLEGLCLWYANIKILVSKWSSLVQNFHAHSPPPQKNF